MQAAPTAETPSPGAERAAPPPSVRPPSPGDWQFHIEGTRRIGVAGSTQPYSEDVITAVTRDGGTDEAPLFRLHTRTGGGEEEDRRRYRASAVELIGTDRASGGMAYGGTMDPPQQILRLPAQVGATWESSWSTGSVDGHSTFRITAIRTVAVAGNGYDSVEVTTESTFSGDADGTRRQIACWVLQLGMIIMSDDHFQGTFNGVPFEIHERRSPYRASVAPAPDSWRAERSRLR